jgi:ribonucleotide monophosphatase NagD (HAD superfamily)
MGLPQTTLLAVLLRFGGGVRVGDDESAPKKANNVARAELRTEPERVPLCSGNTFCSEKYKGYLIDLDGTTYDAAGIIPAAQTFFEQAMKRNIPFVFLSNTGGKTTQGTMQKFITHDEKRDFRINGDAGVQPEYIYTATEAQVRAMCEKIPEQANILAIVDHQFKGGFIDQFETLTNECPPWNMVLTMDLDEAKKWSIAADTQINKYYVVMFVDGKLAPCDPAGSVSAPGAAPLHNENLAGVQVGGGRHKWTFNIEQCKNNGFGDWSFKLFEIISVILFQNNAILFMTAPDNYNPVAKVTRADKSLPEPGPGFFMAAFKYLLDPKLGRSFEGGMANKESLICAGKGGNYGTEYMMQQGLAKLNHIWTTNGGDGELTVDDVAMVGDRYNTDIQGGKDAQMKTILVGTGAHQASDADRFPTERPDEFLNNIAALVDVHVPNPTS